MRKKNYIAGNHGAPCTTELKIKPRLEFQRPDDIHIFGYMADRRDVTRSKAFKENWPDLTVEFPLIERGLTKVACRSIVANMGLREPVTYSWGLPCANCIPCCKATSPDYWANIRHHAPEEFNRMADLCESLPGRRQPIKLTRINNERITIREIPADWPMSKPDQPECDFLCQLAEQED